MISTLKKSYGVGIFTLMFTIACFIVFGMKASANGEYLKLDKSLATEYNNYDTYFNGWNSKTNFIDTDGNIVTEGFALEPDSSYTEKMSIKFYIGDYNYTTLETLVSLDNRSISGDRGKTGVSIYADDKNIYSKTYTNQTPKQQVKLSIPKGSEYLIFYVDIDKGSQGNHGVIFASPFMTNELPESSSFNGKSLSAIGVADSSSSYDVHSGNWGDSSFQLSDGNITARGYGFEPDSSYTERMYAKYYIADYNYTTLETIVSLEGKWRIGERGKTGVQIYADSKLIYSKTFTNQTPLEKLKLAIPSGTKYIKLLVAMDKGSQGNHGIIFSDPILSNSLPVALSNDEVLLSELGISESSSKYDIHYGAWSSKAFQTVDGNIMAEGYGFLPDSIYTSSIYADYFIGDYKHKTFEGSFSLENEWKTGDRGISKASIFADGKLIYSRQLTNSSGIKDFAVSIPSGTQKLRVQVDMNKGNDGNHGIILVDPRLTNAAAKVETPEFMDVSERYSDAVAFVVSKGNNGFSPTSFGTNSNIKRVDAAVMLVKVLGLDIDAAEDSGFKDVPGRAVNYINALKEAGITSGKTMTAFNPDAHITRGELAIWIQRGFKLTSNNTSVPFTDVSESYKSAVAALVSNGVTTGMSTNSFGIQKNAKRGDYAIFLYKASKASEK